MPLARRLPKRGFTNIWRKLFRIVNVDRLNQFEAGTTVDPDALIASGLVKKGNTDIKVLGNGDLKVALTVRAHKFPQSAVKKIEAAGGTVERIGQ